MTSKVSVLASVTDQYTDLFQRCGYESSGDADDTTPSGLWTARTLSVKHFGQVLEEDGLKTSPALGIRRCLHWTARKDDELIIRNKDDSGMVCFEGPIQGGEWW